MSEVKYSRATSLSSIQRSMAASIFFLKVLEKYRSRNVNESFGLSQDIDLVSGNSDERAVGEHAQREAVTIRFLANWFMTAPAAFGIVYLGYSLT